jgi:hypothetical protein
MSEDENVFPMDITDRDPSSRPSKWRPQGYLVTILADAEEAKRAENALVQSGLAPRDVKLYESGEILANHEIYMGRRSAAGKAVGAFVDDAEGRELYLGYAREGRCAMWVRIPNADDVSRVLRVLADYDYAHVRYYGQDTQQDFHIS